MSDQTLFQRALDLYTPPFTFNKYGYLNDSTGQMVADNHVEDSVEETGKEAVIRVRGWGRISYLPDPEKLQDKVGEVLGQAMTEFWLKHGGKDCLQAIPAPDRYSLRGEAVEEARGRYVLWRDYIVAATTLNASVSRMSDQEEELVRLRKELDEANVTVLDLRDQLNETKETLRITQDDLVSANSTLAYKL